MKCISCGYELRKSAAILFIALFVVASVRVVGQDKCNRWWTSWIVQSPTAYFDSPQITCSTIASLYNQQNPNSPSSFMPSPVNDDLWNCLRDGQTYTDIYRAERDDYCDTPVFGPYSIIPDVWDMQIRLPNGKKVALSERPVRGQDFRESQQKQRIRARNKANNGGQVMRSDIWSVPELQGFDYPCPGNKLVENDPADDCSPQIHHIVFRIDSKGCPCGKNSFKNALVITKKLNGEISNNPNHPAAIAIREYYNLQNNPITPYSKSKKPTVVPKKRKVRARP